MLSSEQHLQQLFNISNGTIRHWNGWRYLLNQPKTNLRYPTTNRLYIFNNNNNNNNDHFCFVRYPAAKFNKMFDWENLIIFCILHISEIWDRQLFTKSKEIIIFVFVFYIPCAFISTFRFKAIKIRIAQKNKQINIAKQEKQKLYNFFDEIPWHHSNTKNVIRSI